MTQTWPKCACPLPPLPSILRLLHRRASVSEWMQYFTAPAEERSWRIGLSE